MNDTWYHISTFCDVQPRATLYIAHKHCHREWDDLILFHTGHNIPMSLFKDVWSGNWEFAMAFVKLGRQFQLSSGKTIACWSPWCSPYHLQIHSRGIRVHLKTKFSDEHARFILWIRRLICEKRNCSLPHTEQLTCCARWLQKYRIPVRKNSEVVLQKYKVIERPFRVKVSMYDIPHSVFRCTYPNLFIECFEFRGVDIQNNVGKRYLLTN